MASHLDPENCFVCGYSKEQHTASSGHTFWSNADADKWVAKQLQGDINVEAAYVAQHRPY